MEVIVVDDDWTSFGGWAVIAAVAILICPFWLVSQVIFLIYDFIRFCIKYSLYTNIVKINAVDNKNSAEYVNCAKQICSCRLAFLVDFDNLEKQSTTAQPTTIIFYFLRKHEAVHFKLMHLYN